MTSLTRHGNLIPWSHITSLTRHSNLTLWCQMTNADLYTYSIFTIAKSARNIQSIILVTTISGLNKFLFKFHSFD